MRLQPCCLGGNEAHLGMRLPPRRLGGDEVHLKDVRLYFSPFYSFSSAHLYLVSFFPSLGLKGELCLYGKCVHWESYDNTTHILRLLAVLVVILILITFLIHLSNLFMQNMLCGMWKIFKKFCVEVCLASMMHAPSPRALRFVVWDPMRLSVPGAF